LLDTRSKQPPKNQSKLSLTSAKNNGKILYIGGILMITITDEMLDMIADEYIEKGNKAMTFIQYLEFKLNILKGEVVHG
jgi:hypothetical protein